ncbi:MAG: lysozyme inhibitor LprI family protein [Azoarcus sp.]|nr:lysozyme inhibitor LprI family protein [Azoarcus sp.]
MNRCHAAEYKTADRTLNDVYVSYRATLNEIQKKSLSNAQFAWIKYRDLSCDFETLNARGGSMFQMVLSMCLTEKTHSRIKEIEKLNTCNEGDVSCSR